MNDPQILLNALKQIAYYMDPDNEAEFNMSYFDPVETAIEAIENYEGNVVMMRRR